VIDLDTLQREAGADERRPVVGALILDRHGRVFIQRRGPDREFLPNGWDLAGGHVEAGESLLDALRREVVEETGWTVVGDPQLAFVGDWWIDRGSPASARREFDFLVDVDGDLERPRIEWPKHSEFRWVGPTEVPILDENRGRDDGLVRHLAELALRSTGSASSSYPHVTLLIEPGAARPIEALRRRWDPAMAGQIAAHVTVAYPEEVDSLEELVEAVRSAAFAATPFELRLGSLVYRSGPHWWVGLEVIDPSSGWRLLRDTIVPSQRQRADVQPHVTIVHPRHSNLGAQAWADLNDDPVQESFAVSEVAITAYDGRRWQVVETFPL
jgi:8-oxo-dGTP diphosphatase